MMYNWIRANGEGINQIPKRRRSAFMTASNEKGPSRTTVKSAGRKTRKATSKKRKITQNTTDNEEVKVEDISYARRSEERRVGKECVRTSRSRGWEKDK